MTCTGYTHGITEGTIKIPKDFLKLCLKAFGCCIELRDESLASFNANEYINELKNRGTSDYLKESLDEAEKRLKELRNTNVKEYRNRHIQSEIKSVNYYKEKIEQEKESLNKNIAFLEGFIKEIENIQ